jgi:hypothetical protein
MIDEELVKSAAGYNVGDAVIAGPLLKPHALAVDPAAKTGKRKTRKHLHRVPQDCHLQPGHKSHR